MGFAHIDLPRFSRIALCGHKIAAFTSLQQERQPTVQDKPSIAPAASSMTSRLNWEDFQSADAGGS